MHKPRYKRILLKVSGEALAGREKHGINPGVLDGITGEIAELVSEGIQVALVPGAGNFFRGSLGDSLGIDRVAGDYMGMLATVMNAIALKDSLVKKGLSARVMTAFPMIQAAEPYIIDKARSYMDKGSIVIAAAGTGHPFFTTDTAAALRAIELRADAMLKATRVDGVYSGDPEKDPGARKIDSISCLEVIKNELRVMDLTAVSLCRDNKMPVVVFNLFEKGSLMKIVNGENTGTIIY